MNSERNKALNDALGVTFNGEVTFNGPMFDIHDNEHVHIGMPDGDGYSLKTFMRYYKR